MKRNYTILALWALCSIPILFIESIYNAGFFLSIGMVFSVISVLDLDERINFILVLGGVALIWKIPLMSFYYPLFIYPIFKYNQWHSYYIILGVGVIYIIVGKTQRMEWILTGCLTAIILSVKDHDFYVLSERFNHHFTDLKEKQWYLQYSNKRLIEDQEKNITIAQLNERNRIARDIHDGVGHIQSRAILQLGAIIVTEKDEERKKQLYKLKDSLSYSMVQLRRSLHNMVDENLVLKDAMEKHIQDFNYCPIEFTYDLNKEINLATKYSILFILKEALANIIKHSNCNKVEISLREGEDTIYYLIKDNGTNIETNTDGLGLFSMKKRVLDTGGTMDISMENGFRIFIKLDKEKS